MPSTRTVVLDSHAWLWWAGEAPDLGRRALAAIDAADEIVVPTVCLWEIAMLVERGRVRLDREPVEWMRQALALPRVAPAAISPEIAGRSVALGREGFHPDPADRLIYATAQVLDAALASDDSTIRAFESARPPRAPRHLIW